MSKFRTIEITDPKYEADNLRFIVLKSENLKGRGDICVYVPPQAEAGAVLPVVILLHGVYGSFWAWTHSAGVHFQLNDMINRGELPPMILAMPSDGLWGDGSGYLPHSGYDFEKWIAEDVPQALMEKLDCVTEDSPFFVAGLSMGGYGALRIGVKYHHRFMGISGHSSITSLMQMKLFVEEDLSVYKQADPDDEDVYQTILRYKDSLPPLRFDCGEADQLIEHNRMLHLQLQAAEIGHTYEEFPGGHEWPYWTEHIGKSLRFFAELLKF